MQSITSEESRDAADADTQRDAIAAVLRDEITATSKRGRDFRPSSLIDKPLDSAASIQCSMRRERACVLPAPLRGDVAAGCNLHPVRRKEAAIIRAPRESLVTLALDVSREQVRPVVAARSHVYS